MSSTVFILQAYGLHSHGAHDHDHDGAVVIEDYVAKGLALLAGKDTEFIMTSWASYQIRKIAGWTCAVNAGNVFPTPTSKETAC